jgi:dethiobiotin synthetase
MNPGYYVTGTDTGVGKTLVSVALLQALRDSGKSAVGMKPVASGCSDGGPGWRNEDALALQSASRPEPDYALVNPFALPSATAPQIAAAAAGVAVSSGPILAAFERLAKTADAVVVEGVGGWMAPLADDLQQAQLARALGLPVILVVGIKLGCLNHALLSERAIVDDGVQLAGWIGNAVDPTLAFSEEYIALLQRSLKVPCLGLLPHRRDYDASTFSEYLRLPERG